MPMFMGNVWRKFAKINDVSVALSFIKRLTAGNGHGYTDETRFNGVAGAQAYASFDAKATTIGTTNYDHINGFQARPVHGSTGTIATIYGHTSSPENRGGLATDVFGYHAADAVGAGPVTTQYGYFCAALAKGVNNFAFFSAGSAPSKFGGPTKLSDGYTVAALPAGTIGQRAYVTDANAPVFLAAVVGGGAVVCPVFFNGAAWVVG